MARSPEEMAAAMIANMKEKTGKTLEQWVTLAKKPGDVDKNVKTWLKTAYEQS